MLLFQAPNIFFFALSSVFLIEMFIPSCAQITWLSSSKHKYEHIKESISHFDVDFWFIVLTKCFPFYLHQFDSKSFCLLLWRHCFIAHVSFTYTNHFSFHKGGKHTSKQNTTSKRVKSVAFIFAVSILMDFLFFFFLDTSLLRLCMLCCTIWNKSKCGYGHMSLQIN